MKNSDGDGMLSDTELQTLADKVSAHTGREVSVDEVKAKLDVDRDGAVSMTDLDSGRAHIGKEVAARRMQMQMQTVGGCAEQVESIGVLGFAAAV